MAQASSPVGSV